MEIALIAATLTGNHGAEAMLSATIGRLRERLPGCRFNVFSYYPREDRAALIADDVRVFSYSPTALVALLPSAVLTAVWRAVGLPGAPPGPAGARAMARSCVALDLAGISFADRRAKFLPFNVLTVATPQLMAVPVVKLSQALGPFGDRLNRLAARALLPRCAKVFARGARTAAHLGGLGLDPTRYDVADDVAMLLEDADALTRARAEMPPALELWTGGRETIVGVCPSSLVERQAARLGHDYPATLAVTVEGLVRRGLKVVLFPGASRVGEGHRNNDLPTIRRVLARLALPPAGAGGIAAVDEPVNANLIRKIVGRCDVVLVSRFHAMIAALALGIPTAVVGWGHKYDEVLGAFGVAGASLDYGRLDEEQVLELVERLLEERGERRAAIAAALPRARARALAQIAYVAALVGEA